MEIITMIMLATAIVFTGTATYFVTKNAYSDDHEKLRAHINNQLIINEERDKSHEFSQTVFMSILAILTACVIVYICVKCLINAIQMKISFRRPVAVAQQAQVQPPVQFEA